MDSAHACAAVGNRKGAAFKNAKFDKGEFPMLDDDAVEPSQRTLSRSFASLPSEATSQGSRALSLITSGVIPGAEASVAAGAPIDLRGTSGQADDLRFA